MTWFRRTMSRLTGIEQEIVVGFILAPGARTPETIKQEVIFKMPWLRWTAPEKVVEMLPTIPIPLCRYGQISDLTPKYNPKVRIKILFHGVPHTLEQSQDTVRYPHPERKVIEAARILQDRGVSAIGLGVHNKAFAQAVADDIEVPVTDGNACTTQYLIRALTRGADLLGHHDFKYKSLVIFGIGSVGQAALEVLALEFCKIYVVGNKTPPTKFCRAINDRMEADRAEPMVFEETDRWQAAIRDSQYIITAANNSQPFDIHEFVRPRTVIVDAGMPCNLEYSHLNDMPVLPLFGCNAVLPGKIRSTTRLFPHNKNIVFPCVLGTALKMIGEPIPGDEYGLHKPSAVLEYGRRSDYLGATLAMPTGYDGQPITQERVDWVMAAPY